MGKQHLRCNRPNKINIVSKKRAKKRNPKTRVFATEIKFAPQSRASIATATVARTRSRNYNTRVMFCSRFFVSAQAGGNELACSAPEKAMAAHVVMGVRPGCR